MSMCEITLEANYSQKICDKCIVLDGRQCFVLLTPRVSRRRLPNLSYEILSYVSLSTVLSRP